MMTDINSALLEFPAKQERNAKVSGGAEKLSVFFLQHYLYKPALIESVEESTAESNMMVYSILQKPANSIEHSNGIFVSWNVSSKGSFAHPDVH
ncbi:hypothetical protein AB6A40_000681 [Gnathostoma spinigerum]|uniref:Uncharacterized protein n=1 Tax=Gnathostoma spinigerum TaxID=75299 RepID=A0ABD6EBV3_9BILA